MLVLAHEKPRVVNGILRAWYGVSVQYGDGRFTDAADEDDIPFVC